MNATEWGKAEVTKIQGLSWSQRQSSPQQRGAGCGRAQLYLLLVAGTTATEPQILFRFKYIRERWKGSLEWLLYRQDNYSQD